MKFRSRNTAGGILPTVLVIGGLAGVLIAAQLTMVSHQNTYTMRSQVWAAEVPIAEAGVEEAMAALNCSVELTNTGWTLSGSNYVKTRSLDQGHYHVRISTSSPPTITSIGFGRVPTKSNYTQRTIFVTTGKTPMRYGVASVGPDPLAIGGSCEIDSYNSQDPNWSTNGRYDENKRHDRAGVAVRSTAPNAIKTGSGEIYGFVATGPGGTVSGSIGSFEWLQSHSSPDPRCVRDDFMAEFAPVEVPFAGGQHPDGKLKIGKMTYEHVLGWGDYQMNDASFGDLYVTNRARLRFLRELDLSKNSITIAPGGSLEIYLYGNATIWANALVNNTGVSTNLSIKGLATCRSIQFGGGPVFVGSIYAPQADITFQGNSELTGSLLGYSISADGDVSIHHDEASGVVGQGRLGIATWEEF